MIANKKKSNYTWSAEDNSFVKCMSIFTQQADEKENAVKVQTQFYLVS